MRIHFDSPLEKMRALTHRTTTVHDYFFNNGADSVEWILAKSEQEIEHLRRTFTT